MDDLSIDKTLGGAGAKDTGWSLADGDTLGGYRVVKPLGRGGMGEVYLVENALTRKQYALKLLPSELSRNRGFRERFAREAAVLQEFRHEGIVQVHHAAEEDGRFFLTMDYVDGGSLDDRLKAEGKLPEDEVARIALELCEALSYAHGKGVIHRDIKPANVLLESDGRAKVSDFGLARVVGDDFLKSMTERSISLSTTGTDGGGLSQSDNAVIGTYAYMSPEQKAGQAADERSDIFSLGLMIYMMLTGEKAEGRFDLPSEAGCSSSWDGIVEMTLAAKPERRYAIVAALTADLRLAAEELTAALGRREETERVRAGEEAERVRAGEEAKRREGQRTAVDARRLSLADGFGKRIIIDEMRAGVGDAQIPDEVGILNTIDRDIRVAMGMEWRTPAEASSRYERAAKALGVVVEGRRRRAEAAPKMLTLDIGQAVKTELILVPAGEFMMGSPDSELGRDVGEGPQHRVRIKKQFYMGKYEVTQEQYQRVMGANPSHHKGSNNPVETVSWKEATEFCRKLSQRTGMMVRLPTEAEWEYACRAGTTTPFHYGSSLGSDQANFRGDYPYGGAAKGVNRQKTTSVGRFAANAWGLYDMHGNVYEWCSDWYDQGYYANSPRENPTGPTSGDFRVLRGGGWDDSGSDCRSAYHCWSVPPVCLSSNGFRVVVLPSPRL